MPPFCFSYVLVGFCYTVLTGFSNITLYLLMSSRDELPEAAYMHQLLGLNLLFLLSQNRVSEFHTELERLSARDIQTNVYIRHPVSLEQVLQFTPSHGTISGFDSALLLCCGQVSSIEFWYLCIQLVICILKSKCLHFCCSRKYIQGSVKFSIYIFYDCVNNTLYPLLAFSVLDGGQLQQGISCQRQHPCRELHLFYRYSARHNSVRISMVIILTIIYTLVSLMQPFICAFNQCCCVFFLKNSFVFFRSGPSASCCFKMMLCNYHGCGKSLYMSSLVDSSL